MLVHVFNKKYSAMQKGWGAGVQITGHTSVVQMEPHEFAIIDDDPEGFAAEPNKAKSRNRERDISEGSFWGDVKDHSDLRSRIEHGWIEGVEPVMDLVEEIRDLVPQPIGPRRKLKWGDQGDMVDMARVYSGQLDKAWRSSPRQRDFAPRVISIDVDVCQNAGVGADQLRWAGAAAVALTDALENVGYRVELFSTAGTTYDGEEENKRVKHANITRFMVKRATDPCNPATLAALVALPATFRWYHFQAMTKAPADIGYSWGRAADLTNLLQAAMEENVLEGAEVQMKDSLSREAAIEEVTTVINRITAEQEAGQGTMQ